MGLFDNLFKAKPDAADEAVVEAAKRIADAEKARLLEASKTPATPVAPRTGTVPTARPGSVPPTRAYSPRSLGQVVTPGRSQAGPGKPGEPRPSAIRRLKLSATDSSARPDEVLLLLEDVLPRIPMELVTEGPHDLRRELRFKVEDLSADIARGRAAVSLGRIAEQIPELFLEPIAPADPRQIRLPLQKLVEQIGFLPAKPAPAGASRPAGTAPALEPGSTIFQPFPDAAPASVSVPPAPPVTVPPPVTPPAPVSHAAPSQPTAEPAASPSLRISLRLAEVLRLCPRELVVAELPPISEEDRISFAWPPIEKQLETGEVDISSVRFIFALPAHLQGYFEAREGVRVPLPIDEIRRNIPGREASAEVPSAPEQTGVPDVPGLTAATVGAEATSPMEELRALQVAAEREADIPEVLFARRPAVETPFPEQPETPRTSELCIETSPAAELPSAPAPLAEGKFEVPQQLFVRATEPQPEALIEPAAAEPAAPHVPPPTIAAEAAGPVEVPEVVFVKASAPVSPEAELRPTEIAWKPEVSLPELAQAEAGSEQPLPLPVQMVIHTPPSIPTRPSPLFEQAPLDRPSAEEVKAESPTSPEPVSEPGVVPPVPPIFVPPPLRQSGDALAPEAPVSAEPPPSAAPAESQMTPPNVWMQPPPELGGRPPAAPWPPDVAPPPSPILPVRVVSPPVLRPLVAPPPLFGTGIEESVPHVEALAPEPVAPPPPPPPPPLRLESARLAAGVDESATLDEIGRELIRLPGMTACLLAARHETGLGGELPEGFDAGAALAMARQFAAALDGGGEKLGAGRVQNVTIFAEAYCVSFFSQAEAVICAVHRARAFLPGVKEKLAGVTAALAEA